MRQVESLLESDESAGGFCETPAACCLHVDTPVDVAAAPRLTAGVRLGAYEVLELIGAGGMGEVYRARDTRLGRSVALKTIPAAPFAGGSAIRLMKEAQHASRLKHRNICTIHEVGECDGVPFIAMELVDGQTLAELQRSDVLSLSDALRYAIQVADALTHAHSRGIAHRDLKSSNVMIEPGGRAVVLDFGLARRLPNAEELSDSMTAGEHGLAGTITHMAPELLRGGRGDGRADIWSLGVLLYQLVAGALPFSGSTAFETSSAILEKSPRPLDRRVPLALRLVIERCLRKNPDERYQAAAEVRAALHAISSRRTWRTAGNLLLRSGRVGVPAAAIGMLVTLAVIVILLWGRTGTAVESRSFGTLTVLPLANATGEPAQDFYAAGMTTAIVSQLGAIGDVRVILPPSPAPAEGAARTPADIGRSVGAEAVVQGTLRRSPDRITLDLSVLDATTGRVLWSDTLHRSTQEVLALQADAVGALANAARLALRQGAHERLTLVPAVRPDVYEAYLKGQYEWNRRTPASLHAAVEHFSRAIQLDPAFAPAHAGLAACYNQFGTVMVGTGSPREYRPRAAAEAIRALQIDPNSSEAHAALGYVRHYDWEWAESEKAFLRAIELNPSNALARLWYANLLMSRRRFDESLRQAYAARDLDPFSLVVNTNIGWILHFAGRHQDAVAHLTRTVAIDPDYSQAQWRLADVLTTMGRYDEALARLEDILRQARSPSNLSLLATIYAHMGRTAQARSVLRELLAAAESQYVPPSTIGTVYGALGELDTAIDWMERSIEERSNAAAYMAVVPSNAPLRAHPRFQALLQRIGAK
ncbi:MAG TPA: tetratricopeptide repeat protein [Vicinamibacterales bacterium]|nr:tetratricopeptide repeat protein [Vicinamibacterales bacterium]